MKEKKSFILLWGGYIIGFIVLLLALNAYEGAKYIVYSRYKDNPTITREIHFGSLQSLKTSTVNEICNMLGQDSKIHIDSINYFVNVENSHKQKNRYKVDFLNYSKDNFFKFKLNSGRYFTVDEMKNNTKVVLINQEVYKFLKMSSLDNCYITINNDKFKVIGVLNNVGTYIYLPVKNLNVVNLNDANGSYFYCNMDVANLNGNIDNLSKLIGKKLQNEYNGNISILVPEEEVAGDIAITYKSLSLFSIAILLVSIINSSSLSLIWIHNKSKEITIKKSLGAPNIILIIEIVKMLFIISLLSIIIGIVLDYFLINNVISSIQELNLILNYEVVIKSIVVSFVVGILSSITAVIKILRFNIAYNLKTN
ncbi:putative ABC transport system permease protein [Clostridium acetobutylicum]|uniref:Uncharacterized conserved membrane protein, possible permease n=1 Tax=Clostridium acetobutylicum (strain ATCC 824 / DSM 792 / JCM 1419 / IAM 19013 / LMG 5710 / NBRC 13948 / NRRL B-527 / VKM B-1787 / 2291 / W) TaxID=272562 RepID=Q97D66_CLOAB|nr:MULTISPECIES: ABC transporter permease [Clostridium]AAK81537.1 Uncharacterized conserved membrane protein, possible permease [Clostridium acetobutylicum ATCC 824]ADZ22658.1 Conserved hypothetical protein [Clostridium acetobutylicum EA 2018]AEI32959.1 hypothetical protein SMB_G3655 [Clostridium acetobutylicum DSM 1731]AWV80790.1 hypothetical protein DK921_11890 [Clostridium acetobutylicum]MBC2393885.1 ABC transporter permease [Clostridium acetobutylicum]